MTTGSRGSGFRPDALRSMVPPLTPAVKGLVIACAAGYAAQLLLDLAGGGGFDPYGIVLQAFGLVPHEVLHGLRLWQPVTYLFLHGGFGHLLFNMLALWMFGATLEPEWGARRFLFYYFLTGIGAGIFTVALTPSADNPTIGASGAIFGILLAFAYTHPNRLVFLYFVFPIKAKWFALGLGVMTLLSSWAYSGSGGVAHIAHLGGMLFGYAYLKKVWRVGEIYRELRWRLRRRRFRIIEKRGNGDPRFPFH